MERLSLSNENVDDEASEIHERWMAFLKTEETLDKENVTGRTEMIRNILQGEQFKV